MFVLFVLLGALFIGLSCFLAEECGHSCTITNKADRTRIAPNRSQLTEALDKLLSLYQDGVLTEEQYLSAADKLIDQLVIVVNSEASPCQSESVATNDLRQFDLEGSIKVDINN